MKSLKKLINEVKGEKAHREAVAMGLKYKGFGYWVDPGTGETKFKTENDELVPVEADVESDMWHDPKGIGDQPMQGGQAGPMGMMQPGMAGRPGMPQAVPGEGLGPAPEPGEETPPPQLGWEPGPDGDTCVDTDEPPGEIPIDSYVGRPNNLNWSAGPQGSNFTNVTFAQMKDVMEQMFTEGNVTKIAREAKGRMNADAPASRKVDTEDMRLAAAAVVKDRGMSTGTDAGTRTLQGREIKNHINNNLGGNIDTEGAKDIVDVRKDMQSKSWDRMSKQKADLQNDPVFRNIDNSEQAKLLHSLFSRHGDKKHFANTDQRDRMMPDVIKRKMAKHTPESPVHQLNTKLRKSGMFSDPDYNLDQEGEYLNEGAFGQTYLTDDNKVIKHGMFGENELLSLAKLKDVKGVPNLVNARFDTAFGEGQGSDRWAEGTYAMDVVPGEPIADFWDSGEIKSPKEALEQIWRLRGDMHKAGIAHNDMHGANILWDEENQQASLVDFGLAQNGNMEALMEALSGINGSDMPFNGGYGTPWLDEDNGGHFENGEGYWDDFRGRINDNVEKVREALLDRSDPDMHLPDDVESFMMGHLMTDRKADREENVRSWREDGLVGGLEDDEFVGSLIEMLYEGIGQQQHPSPALERDLDSLLKDIRGNK